MSAFIVSLLFIFILLALPGWTLIRASAFLAFPVAFWSIISLNYIAKGKKASLNKKPIAIMILIFIMSLAFTTTILQFEKNQYYDYMTHPSELSSLSFLAAHIQQRSAPWIIAAHPETDLYAPYFMYDTNNVILPYLSVESLTLYANDRNQTRLLSSLNETVNLSDFMIRGIRDRLLLGDQFSQESLETLVTLDQRLATPGFNVIYSNGYYWTISKTPGH
jgi:hypothetical protein